VFRSAIRCCTATAQRIDDARKLYEQPVACRLDEPAVVLGDLRVKKLAA
jgi:hypothetical protein